MPQSDSHECEATWGNQLFQSTWVMHVKCPLARRQSFSLKCGKWEKWH